MNSNRRNHADSALMAALRTGDLSVLGELYERYHAAIFNFLRRATGSTSQAEDLTQEVFLRVLRYRASFNPDYDFKPWVYRIARNLLHDNAPMDPPLQGPDDCEEFADRRPSPQRIVEGKQTVDRMEEALARLSREQREALLLARFHDLSYRQIGQVLSCSEGAVKARVFRAIKRLDELMNDERR